MKPKLYTLENGLRVVLEENHTAPVLSLQAMVTVGSADETNDEAGISHVIEHMLFKGTHHRKVGEIARDVESAGGDINAYTSFDQTVFYIHMAKRFADKGLEILADAVMHPTFDAAELEREKEVIVEEIRRERDNPSRFVGEILFENAFRRHTYGRPIIGFEKTVRSFTQEKLFQFYRRWYVPQNTIFILVGDFDSKVWLKKIEHVFSEFKNTNFTPPTTLRRPEPPQEAAVFAAKPDNIQSLQFCLGFHVPQITHEHVPCLDLLSHILGGAQSSRLEQVLKEKKRLVQNIYAYAYTPRDPGLFIVGGQCNTAQALKAFAAYAVELERLKQEGPTAEELKHAKLNIRATQTYEKETVGGQAGKLAYFLATAGALDFEEGYYQRLQHVEAAEIQEAARRYLTPQNMTAAILVPKKEHSKNWESQIRKILLQSPSPRGKKISRKIAADRSRLVKLPGGLRLILKEEPSLPIITICSASLGGLLAESKTDNGLHHLMAQCLTKGTKNRPALEIARATEALAGSLEGYSGKNSYGLRMEFLSDYLKEGLDLFCEVLLEPAFDAKEAAREKKLALEAIKNQEDQLASLAFHHFQKTLFPNHPYGMRALGSLESVPHITPAQLKRGHRRRLTKSNTVITVVGDFSAAALTEVLAQKLKILPARKSSFEKPVRDPKPPRILKIEVTKKKEQAHIVLGFQGPTLFSADHYAMIVLNNILSGMGGRLFLELRDKKSLAYTVTSYLMEGVDPGYFAVYIGTEPGKVPTALDGIKGELQKICRDGVTDEELERTKNYLVGTYELDLQKNTTLAQSYAFNELYGLGYREVARYPEKILKVTREAVLQAAQKYIHLDAYVLSVIRP